LFGGSRVKGKLSILEVALARGAWQKAVWAIACLCMAVIALAVAMVLADREPSYRGRTLPQWVKRYQDAESLLYARDTEKEKAESKEAVLDLLSKNTSTVVSYFSHDPGEYLQRRNTQIQFVPRFLMLPAWRFLGWFAPDRGSDLSGAAMQAFRIAGPQADFAVPELKRLMLGTNKYGSFAASVSLTYIGEAARGPLEEVITNRTHPFRFHAVTAVAGLPGGRTAASNVLSIALQDPDRQVREVATNVLVFTNVHQWMLSRRKERSP